MYVLGEGVGVSRCQRNLSPPRFKSGEVFFLEQNGLSIHPSACVQVPPHFLELGKEKKIEERPPRN